MSELKKCPFCGGDSCYGVDDFGDVSVCCLYLSQGDTWNTRPLEDALSARVTALEGELRKIEGYCNNATKYGDGKLVADILVKSIQEVLK